MTPEQIQALVDGAVDKALGGGETQSAPAAPAPAPATSPLERVLGQLAELQAAQLAGQMASQFQSPGGPSAPAPVSQWDPASPGSLKHATAAEVLQMRREGSLLKHVAAYRATLDGGDGVPLFVRAARPGKGR